MLGNYVWCNNSVLFVSLFIRLNRQSGQGDLCVPSNDQRAGIKNKKVGVLTCRFILRGQRRYLRAGFPGD